MVKLTSSLNRPLVNYLWLYKINFYLLFSIFSGIEDVRLGDEFQRHGEESTLSGTEMPQDSGTYQCRLWVRLLQFKISGKCPRTVNISSDIFQKYPFDLEIDFEMLHSIYDTVNS